MEEYSIGTVLRLLRVVSTFSKRNDSDVEDSRSRGGTEDFRFGIWLLLIWLLFDSFQ